MAVTTISRTWYNTLVDDDGTLTTGTVWDKAAVDSLLDAIDALLAGNITFGGTLHEFSGASATSCQLLIENTEGAAGYSQFVMKSRGAIDALLTAENGLLSIEAPLASGLTVSATNGAGVIKFATGGSTVRAQINANGTQIWAPYGAGTATFDASGNITSVSDRRFKDRLRPLPYGLAEVLKLKPIQHGYNKRSGLERKHLYGGFTAQDVRKAGMPLAVGRDARGFLTLADRPILGATVNAIHELTVRIARLERKAA